MKFREKHPYLYFEGIGILGIILACLFEKVSTSIFNILMAISVIDIIVSPIIITILKMSGKYFKSVRKASNLDNTKVISGRQQILKILKSKAEIVYKLSGALLFVGFLVLVSSFLIGETEQDIIAWGIIPIVLGIGISLIGFMYIGGEKSLYVKRRPDIFELAEDLIQNTIFKNYYFIISTKAIAVRYDISRIANRNDVVCIRGCSYLSRWQRPGIYLNLNNHKHVHIYGIPDEKIMKDLIITISNYCPNVTEKYLNGESI